MLDNLRKKQLLAQLNSHANTNGALDPKEKDAQRSPANAKGLFQPEIEQGYDAREEYSKRTGIPMSTLMDKEAEAQAQDPMIYSENNKMMESSGRAVGKSIGASSSTERMRKPIYESLNQEDDEDSEKNKALRNLYKKGK